MLDLSSSMMALGARQMGAVVGGTAAWQAAGAALRLLQQSADLAGAALPRAAGIEWLELASKLEAFDHFQQPPPLRRPDGGAAPLPEQVRRAETLGAYRAVWTFEGLGYAHAERAWLAGAPRRLLAGEALRGVPAAAVLPLHTGAALCFAGRALEEGEAASAAGLERSIALWAESAEDPGYGDLVVEALGLVMRNLHPYRVRRTAELLAALGPQLAESFWHGVGRGLYFAPTHALPWSGAAGRAFAKAWSEPPDEAGRRNATAGLAWALALVNVRHPEVLADVLSLHRREIGSDDAFANGVASAMVVWSRAAGRDHHLATFLGHRPEGAAAALWDDLVRAPCEAALEDAGRGLRRPGGPVALFRYRPTVEEGGRGS